MSGSFLPPFEKGGIHLWRGELTPGAGRLAALASVLSRDELERASRYRFAVHRDRFIAGRGLLREVLSSYLGKSPETLAFQTGPFGKPELDGVHFNMAHAENQIGIAVAPSPVGFDLELMRPMPELDDLALQVFSAEELEAWAHFPDVGRMDAFLRLWTRKEALLKGIGLGITQHLKDVSVFFRTGSPLRTPAELEGGAWHLNTFVEGPVYASIAQRGAIEQVTTLQLA